MTNEQKWQLYKRLVSVADAGLYYGQDAFDHERYQEIKEIALELLADLTDTSTEQLAVLFGQEAGYPTPKVDVRAFIEREGQVLLVQDKHTAEWSLPGGYAEVGLSPTANIVKEVKEETGLDVVETQLRAVYDTNLREDIIQPFQYYKFIFACEVVGEIRQNFETDKEVQAVRYFSREDLPVLSQVRTTEAQLQQLFKHEPAIYVE
ncbi:DNA mismatch repair protein MutT [Dolosigranulum pigrum]|jgi:hydrolase, NUDIX family|uniref:Nudix hydrolase domain-containing protein n=2 Tax=Dolosigranulum pigrum TaxID=29394 RepID=H3NGH6_9LACT|nr:NUDIX hydrolase [Dolosigranulum pigrum]EHR31740.1 hypothetical protein HMPREF9703_01618 [Dolosigranulum pigrum ATCC 51524]QDO91989.1 NUDIX hydrolase [Dolosigranulum pigrum]QTJ36920.1 NUDIX hydrolase [Dolosigranulum pigrum]RAN55372.1 DNA mismatch repair protein MutT [Dolosigranulum pigrum]RAN60485.1 DNA mismatch repair protein MutT [Dolosigranulum pigrum]